MKALVAAVMLVALAGCGGSKISSMPTMNKPEAAIHTVALDPGGGLMADAVGVELYGYGFNIIDTSQVSQLLVRVNLEEIQINQPQGLRYLADQGIDALLVVHSSAGYDGQPESASARVRDTRSGAVVGGATWQNGWGGHAGSIADRTMRSGLVEAAADIAEAIAPQLR